MPLLTALPLRYPQARLSVLANSCNAAALEGNEDKNALYSYTKRKHRGERSGLGISGSIRRSSPRFGSQPPAPGTPSGLDREDPPPYETTSGALLESGIGG
jgi:hypothetical protein